MAMGHSRDLVTPSGLQAQSSHHDWEIPQSNHPLAQSRNLVTAPLWQTGCGHTPDALRAKPAHEPRARGRGSTLCSAVWPAKRLGWRPYLRADRPVLSRTSDAPGCDGPDQKIPRNTSTYAVPTAPWPLLDRVEKSSPVGHAHALGRSLKKTKTDPKKTRQRRFLEEDGVRRIRTFTPAKSRQIRPGGHIYNCLLYT